MKIEFNLDPKILIAVAIGAILGAIATFILTRRTREQFDKLKSAHKRMCEQVSAYYQLTSLCGMEIANLINDGNMENSLFRDALNPKGTEKIERDYFIEFLRKRVSDGGFSHPSMTSRDAKNSEDSFK